MSASALPDASGASGAVIARDITRSDGPGAWLLVIADIDMATETQARAELAAFSATEPPRVVLQFGDEGYVDVRGLSVLLEAGRALHRRGGGLLALDAPYSLRRMLEILDVGAELGIARSRVQAESWLAGVRDH